MRASTPGGRCRCEAMTARAFVIDQARCIGCHACTVACKVEHGTELGVFRTWVKSVDAGVYPQARRSFAVLRCNHCARPPCVAICPVGALFRRTDGIVEFDSERCIGCKACLNACPYDALHIDPASGTAAKCNFCAHRIELGRAPSCELACPTGAILSGDLDDPEDLISRRLAGAQRVVRAPEKDTDPKLFYLAPDPAVLDPLAPRREAGYLTTELPRSQHPDPRGPRGAALVTADVAHPPPWGWKVSSYFVTKGIAAGAMMLAAPLHELAPGRSGVGLDVLALGAIGVTGALLVGDLRRPARFLSLFLRPQWGSWLARGAFVVAVAAGLAALALVFGVLGWRTPLIVCDWCCLPAGAALAGYSALLFGQCAGRELWRSPLLPAHTIAAALLAGVGALGVLAAFAHGSAVPRAALAVTLATAAAVSAGIAGFDAWRSTATAHLRRAVRELRGARRVRFAVLAGVVGPVGLAVAFLADGGPGLLALAGASVLAGLWCYEDGWVRAGQSVPLS